MILEVPIYISIKSSSSINIQHRPRKDSDLTSHSFIPMYIWLFIPITIASEHDQRLDRKQPAAPPTLSFVFNYEINSHLVIGLCFILIEATGVIIMRERFRPAIFSAIPADVPCAKDRGEHETPCKNLKTSPPSPRCKENPTVLLKALFVCLSMDLILEI